MVPAGTHARHGGAQRSEATEGARALVRVRVRDRVRVRVGARVGARVSG